jgi:hypothetical protein
MVAIRSAQPLPKYAVRPSTATAEQWPYGQRSATEASPAATWPEHSTMTEETTAEPNMDPFVMTTPFSRAWEQYGSWVAWSHEEVVWFLL